MIVTDDDVAIGDKLTTTVLPDMIAGCCGRAGRLRDLDSARRVLAIDLP